MRAYQDLVFNTAFRLLNSEAEAKDISQEVFLKAYERFEELSGSPTVGGWLKTVARNLSLNHLNRYRSRWRFFSEFARGEDESESAAMPDLPAPDAFGESVERADRSHRVGELLGKLPRNQRVSLVLYHFEELSYEEIASQLGVSLAKVKTDIFRAREALRRQLRLEVDEGGAGDPGGSPDGGGVPMGASPFLI